MAFICIVRWLLRALGTHKSHFQDSWRFELASSIFKLTCPIGQKLPTFRLVEVTEIFKRTIQLKHSNITSFVIFKEASNFEVPRRSFQDEVRRITRRVTRRAITNLVAPWQVWSKLKNYLIFEKKKNPKIQVLPTEAGTTEMPNFFLIRFFRKKLPTSQCSRSIDYQVTANLRSSFRSELFSLRPKTIRLAPLENLQLQKSIPGSQTSEPQKSWTWPTPV